MNKKVFRGMSSAAIATILASTIATPAFAEVTGYIVKDSKTGKHYVYNYEKLQDEYIKHKNNKKSALYEDYLNYELVGVEDDKAGFVDIESLEDQYLQHKTEFDIDKFAENASPEAILKIDKIAEKEIDKDGNIVEVDKSIESATVKAAKDAVEAYEKAPITSNEEIAAAEKLGQVATKKVNLVKDEKVKAELTAKIEAQNAKIAEAKKELNKVEVKEVSAINVTTVVVTLADGADATKAADKAQYTVKVGEKNVEVSAVNYDVTTKKATLTVDLSNLEGTVTVNEIASVKAIDYVAPSIAEVKAQSATVIDIKFNEKVDASEAEKAENYTLRYAVGKATSLTFNTGSDEQHKVQATAKLLADGQTVRMTIVSVGANVAFAGLQNGGLVKDAPYQISVADKVVDTSGNKTVSGYGVVFYGTNIADSQAAQVLSAKYDSSTGMLTLSFDKAVETTTASKIKLVAEGKDAVALDALSGVSKGSSVEIDAKTLATKIAVLGNTFSVQYADGAFVDVNGNNVVSATTAVTVTEGLKATGASYDANKNVLTLSFNDLVDISKVPDDLSKIKISGKTIDAKPAGKISTKLLNTTNSKNIQIQLADETKAGEGTAELEAAILDNKDKEDGVVVSFKASEVAFTAVGEKVPMAIVGDEVTIKKAVYVADTVAPTLTSASLKGIVADNGTITLTFSEKVDPAAVKGADIAFYDAKDLTKAITTLDKADATEKTAGTFVDTLTFKLDASADTKAVAKSISDALTAKKSLVVSVKAKAIKDLNGTEIAELAPANAVAATVLESTADAKADVFKAAPVGAKIVNLYVGKDSTGGDSNYSQGEGVALDKVTAENVANYTVIPTNGGAAIKVNSAVYTWDASKKDAYVTLYLDAAATGKNYTITATGLKTQAGVAVEKDTKSGKFIAAFDGAAAAETNATVASVTADVNANGKFDAGDTITLDFGTPIHLADGAKASDIKVNAPASGTPVAGTLGSSTIKVDGSKLVITLASDAKIAVGNEVVLAKTDSKILNADDQVAYFDVAAAVAAPTVDAPMIKTAVYNDANTNGVLDKDDTITVTFTSKVAIAAGKSASDLEGDFVLGETGATYTVKLADDGMGATLTLTDPKSFVPGTTTINVADSSVDLVGNWNKALTKEATADKVVKVAKSDVAQPTVQSAKYVVKEDGTKIIVLQMSEKVSVDSNNNKFNKNFKVVSTDTATINGEDIISVDPENATKLVITLDNNDVVVPGLSQIKVTLANTNGVTDANGNYMMFDNNAITIEK